MGFFDKIRKIRENIQSPVIIVAGNVYDLFQIGGTFQPLIPFLCDSLASLDNSFQLVYELNGPIRMTFEVKNKLKEAWIEFRTGEKPNDLLLKELKQNVQGKKSSVERFGEDFEANLNDSIGNPSCALEFFRQLTLCSRKVLKRNLTIIIEAADMLLPAGNGDIASLNDKQLHRISIVQDWFGDPGFLNGHDTVYLIADSRSLIHPRISKLPQVLSVDVPSPDLELRKAFLTALDVENPQEVAELSASLSLVALSQLAKSNKTPSKEEIIGKVEEFIQAQLGEDVIEFKKPSHKLKDCIGNTALKKFLETVFIPRMQLTGEGLLPGAAVAGPIGGGKTFVFEAVASEVNMPVLVLKNIRSQWFGQTDVIFERLRRVLEALNRVLIFVDEADTQFGGVGEGSHETERRLTGKIQAMMSEPKLKGKIYWLLMTARIHLLSPDIRRPGRAGDLIVPVLDPIGDDRKDFIKWTIKSITVGDKPALDLESEGLIDLLDKQIPQDYSAASYASLKNNLTFKKNFPTWHDLVEEIKDILPPAIALARRYQTLQALANCTRRSLLPNPNVTDAERKSWETEIMQLEAAGIK